MKPDRWREIERLYHAARDRKPDEIAAFLDESCGGDNSLRREVESLLAHRLRAEKFIESPALEAAGGILAKNQPSQSAAGGAQRIQEFTGEAGQRPSRRGKLPPLWIFLISMPFVTCAGFLYFWLFSDLCRWAGSYNWPTRPVLKAGTESRISAGNPRLLARAFSEAISSLGRIWTSSAPPIHVRLTNFDSWSNAAINAGN